MPKIRLNRDTMDMLRTQVLPGFSFASLATECEDGLFEVPVDDEVAMIIAAARLPGESDNDVVSRLVRAATGRRPDLGTVGYFVREAGSRHWLTNLSLKTTANWVLASIHSRGGRFHSAASWRHRHWGSAHAS